MVVKPMSMLTKSGEPGVPASLVVNGTRYSSAKKQQTRSQLLKSSNNYLYSDQQNHTTTTTTTTTTSPEQLITRRGPSSHVTTTNEPTLDHVKFETKFERDTINNITTNSVQLAGGGATVNHHQQQEFGGHHPSLHLPEMLSTKGHAVTRVDSRDELSSLRSRLASLRAGGQVSEGGNHHHHHLLNGAGSIVVLDSSGSEELLRRKSSSPAKHGGGMAAKAQRITTLHGAAVEPRSVDDIATPAAAMQISLEKSKKERSSTRSSRNRQQQQQQQQQQTTVNVVQENLSNGEFQMVYEKDQEQKMMMSSNPVRQAVHEIAEKARRSRNRIHHQGTTDAVDHVEKVEGKVDDVVVGGGDKPSLPGVAAMGPSMFQDVIDEVSRIHHHHPRSSLIQQQQQQVSSVDVVDRDSPRGGVLVTESNGRSSFNFHHDGLRLRGAGHSVSPLRSGGGGGHEVREDSVRGFTVKGIQGGDQASLQHPAAHPSSLERDDGDHSLNNNYGGNFLQPRGTARAASLHHGQVDNPVNKHNSSSLRSYHSGYEREAELHSLHRNHHVVPAEHSNRGRATSFSRKAGNKSGQTWFAATELQSNLLVEVMDCEYHLHKFPLLSRSGRLNRLVFESRDTNNDHIKLDAIPGGPEAFELAVKFCYGIPVELTPQNVATLRCAAEYLEMTDSLEDGNLVSKTEHYLSFVVLASWKDSITVLQSCNRLLPWAEELQIVRRCSESVAWKACTDPHGIRWSFSSNSSAPPVLWDGLKQAQVGKHIPHDWWLEDVIQLNFDAFSRVMTAIKVKGMAYTLVGSAIAQYATKWLPGLEKKSRIKQQHVDVNKSEALSQGITGKEIVVRETQDAPSHNQIENRALVEGIVGMLPPQLDAVSCSFLLRLLRVACLSGAGPPCKGELERRVGMQMEHASLSDLLIPSSQSSTDSLYDIDVVQRILEQFLLKDHSGATSPTRSVTPEKQLSVFENGASKPPPAPPTTKIKVAKLMDAYLAEVARDTNLPLSKFQVLAESLPEFSRPSDDGLYRAIDTYLKTHPTMTEHERKKLCRVMDCQRLSLEACLHAAQNERLPLRVVVQVLFSEQVKLRNAITGNTLVRKNRDQGADSARPSTREQSQAGTNQPGVPRLDNSNAGGLSLQESWQSARRDIKSLKQEIERMKSKFSDLEQDYTGMTQQVEKLSKSKSHSTSGWTSGWRRLSSHMKPPNLFNHSKSDFEYPHKDDESIAPTHDSTPSHDQSTPTSATEQRRRSHSITSTSSVQRWRNSIS